MRKRGRKNIVKFPIRYMIEIKPKDIVMIICTFIGIVFTIMQIYDWIRGHKKLDIVVQDDISITYLNRNIVQHNNIYPLFEDYVDFDKEYLFTENCATQLMITNHYNNQVVIDKIILEANEIKVDYSPVLTFLNGYESEEGIGVTIVNTGWGTAKNLKIGMVGTDKNLEEYFKKEALEFEVPLVNSAEQVEVPLLKNTDLLANLADGMGFSIDFDVECECEGNPVVYSEVGFYIYDGKLMFGGVGDYAQQIYGIKIDTEKDNFLWEESISEFIDQGETLVLPICFFPDRSCSLKLKISFEIVNDGKKEITSTEASEMYFTVSSIPGWNYKLSSPVDEIRDMSDEEMENININNDVIVSYPENSGIKIRP